MEGDAGKNAREAVRSGKYNLYDFRLDADINATEGALCGGSATILLDPNPGIHMDCFRKMSASLDKGQPGLMLTIVSNTADTPIRRYWLESDRLNPADLPVELLQNLPAERSEEKSGDRKRDRSEDSPGERHGVEQEKWLGEWPMIPTWIMDRMIEQYKQSEKDILIASVDGKRGHPMIFSAKYIPEILAFGPEDSLRDLPGKHPGEVEEMETGIPEILRDIDTPQDYKNEKSIIK